MVKKLKVTRRSMKSYFLSGRKREMRLVHSLTRNTSSDCIRYGMAKTFQPISKSVSMYVLKSHQGRDVIYGCWAICVSDNLNAGTKGTFMNDAAALRA